MTETDRRDADDMTPGAVTVQPSGEPVAGDTTIDEETPDRAGPDGAKETPLAEDVGDRPRREPAPDAEDGWSALLGDTSAFANRWDAIQAGFVDEPRRAVEEAHALVAHVTERLAESFSRERSRLEEQWSRGDEVGTEDLRVALRRYRTFFNQLLSR